METTIHVRKCSNCVYGIPLTKIRPPVDLEDRTYCCVRDAFAEYDDGEVFEMMPYECCDKHMTKDEINKLVNGGGMILCCLN